MSRDDAFASRRQFIIAASIVAAGLPLHARAAELALSEDRNHRVRQRRQALGRAWATAGHAVMFASRHLDEDQALATRVGAATPARPSKRLRSAKFSAASRIERCPSWARLWRLICRARS